MSESLSLFDDEPRQNHGARGQRDRHGRDRHYEAARRLAQRMDRLEDHSPAQAAAGQRICRHLVAMLQAASGRPQDSGLDH